MVVYLARSRVVVKRRAHNVQDFRVEARWPIRHVSDRAEKAVRQIARNAGRRVLWQTNAVIAPGVPETGGQAVVFVSAAFCLGQPERDLQFTDGSDHLADLSN